MKTFRLGQIIAERTLFWEKDEDSKVIIKIGQPYPVEPEQVGTLYMCPYQIENLGSGELPVEFRGGMDSIDALQNALAAIGQSLYDAQSKVGGRLCWGDRSNPGLGFPDARPKP